MLSRSLKLNIVLFSATTLNNKNKPFSDVKVILKFFSFPDKIHLDFLDQNIVKFCN
jgi:hypothetical protein